ncbi:MAG: alpha/beta hydrolase [Trueperaceae bacterium]|nr:alpha/beta hydrolase [Trueperaceae bacterium]
MNRTTFAHRRPAPRTKLLVGLTGLSAFLAPLAAAQGAAGTGEPAPAVVYDLSVGGAAVGEVGVALTRAGAAGGESRSHLEVPGAFDLTDHLVTAENGAARAYALTGTFQGVAISIAVGFAPDAAAFTIEQGGQKQQLSLPLPGDVYVMDNNFLDGMQFIVDRAVAAGGDLEVDVIVPQAVVLGRMELQAPVAATVRYAGAEVAARRVEASMSVGAQTAKLVAYLDDAGTILVLTSDPGAARFERRAQGAEDAGAQGAARATGAAATLAAQQAALDARLAEQSACLVERDAAVVSAGAQLVGKLTLPRSAADGGRPAPTLVLLPGSGPVDLDGNTPPVLVNAGYKQLAYALACHGYGVLRASKLGIPPSTGDASAVTIATYARNLADWFAFLADQPGVDATRLGVMGHSEGGLVALYAVAEGYVAPAAVVLLASPGRPLDVVLREQLLARSAEAGAGQEQLAELAGQIDDLVAAVRASTGTALEVTPELQANPLTPLFANAAGLLRSEFAQDPAELAARVSVPVAVLQGEKDIQIGVNDAEAIAGAASGSTLLLFPDLTHNLVDTRGPALSLPLPGAGAQVSPTLVQVIATYLAGNLRPGR